MIVDRGQVNETRSNETRWQGTLTGAQVGAMLVAGLRDELCPHKKVVLHILATRPDPEGSSLPSVDFALVHDHDYILKQPVPELNDRRRDCTCPTSRNPEGCSSLACPRRPADA